jgi:carotenoid 1,2-hydratase
VSEIHAVRPGGYAWWYFDAVSDDGARALTAIFFVGSVFSPDYAARLRRGEPARAEEHVAVNLALYERDQKRAWVMSEYGAHGLHALDAGGPRIGNSAVSATAHGLRVTIDEHAAPFMLSIARLGGRVRGEFELERHAPAGAEVELIATPARHVWQPRLPLARVRVRFTEPRFAFDGLGYHDVNAGDGRLEHAFASWSWARFHQPDRTQILYALQERSGASRALVVEATPDAPAVMRPATLLPEGERIRAPWGLPMPRWFALDDAGTTLRCSAGTLYEAAPFYARYAASLQRSGRGVPSDGRPVAGVGEYLDLDRFASPGLQFLLRFKTRRMK